MSDRFDPDNIGEDRIIVSLDSGQQAPLAGRPVSVSFDYARADAAGGVQGTVVVAVQPALGDGEHYQSEIFTAPPVAFTFVPRHAGPHLLTIRESAHNRWQGRLLIEVGGGELKPLRSLSAERANPFTLQVPLPNDSALLGVLGPKGDALIAEEQYLTLTPDGSGGFDVDEWVGIEGIYLMTASTAPLWLPSGGVDGRPGVRFDGISEYMQGTGLPWVAGDRPGIFSVSSFQDVTDEADDNLLMLSEASLRFIRHATIRTSASNNTFRGSTTSALSGGDALIDYGAPETEGANVPHLHETHAYSTGFEAGMDGSLSAHASSGALADTLSDLTIGANYTSSAPVAATVSEIVLWDVSAAGAVDKAAAYRALRVARLYPTIGAALP